MRFPPQLPSNNKIQSRLQISFWVVGFFDFKRLKTTCSCHPFQCFTLEVYYANFNYSVLFNLLPNLAYLYSHQNSHRVTFKISIICTLGVKNGKLSSTQKFTAIWFYNRCQNTRPKYGKSSCLLWYLNENRAHLRFQSKKKYFQKHFK